MFYPQYRTLRIAELLQEQWGLMRVPGLLKLIDVCHPKRVLEIGSYRGVSTELFLLYAEHVTAVDPWPDEDIYRQFMERAGSYPHCRTIRGESPDVVRHGLVMAGNYDLVYIDGNHSYEAVVDDIRIGKHVQAEWIGGHDYDGSDTPGVRKAVEYCFPGDSPLLFSDMNWLMEAD